MSFGNGKKRPKNGPGTREAVRLFQKHRDNVRFDWVGCDGPRVIAALDAATASGAAVMFGSVQGGRGIVVTVFAGEERHKEYAMFGDEFTQLMEDIILGLQSSSESVHQIHGLAPLGAVEGEGDDA